MNLWLIQTIRREKVGRWPQNRTIKKGKQTNNKSLSRHNAFFRRAEMDGKWLRIRITKIKQDFFCLITISVLEGRRWLADDHSQSLFPNWLFASKCLSYQVLFLHNLVLRSNKLNHLKQKSFPSGGTESPRPRWSSMLEASGMRYHHHPFYHHLPPIANCHQPFKVFPMSWSIS